MMNAKRILICSYYMPQADLDSFSRRLLHFVEFLSDAGWSVTCVARMPTGVEEYAGVLEALGATVHVGFEEHLEDVAKTGRFDVALLGFWHIADRTMRLLRRCSPSTKVIVDSGDLHFLRHARRILGESTPDDRLEIFDTKYAEETRRELNAYAVADAVFAVSRKEADFVNDFVGERARAFAVPDCEDLPRSTVPAADRRGLFFVGNFEHLPNVEAVEFLCRDILPQLDPVVMADHPVYIAGNAMTPAVEQCAAGLPFVHMLGWIPSVQPYLDTVRVSILPLLHGAGTKRKMIQALAIGTPSVSTTIGVEGFDLRDGEEVLIADDPVLFANAIARLLHDDVLWERLARQGRDRILVEHGRETARHRLMQALSAVLSKPARAVATHTRALSPRQASEREYQALIRRLPTVIAEVVPEGATVLVVSKGDEALLKFSDRTAWHFPRCSDGTYPGYYPANSHDAITQLEALLELGADFLVFPTPALWWLEHYADFGAHLERSYRMVVREDSSGIIYALREAPGLDPVALSTQPVPTEPLADSATTPAVHQLQTPPSLAYRRHRVRQSSGADGKGEVLVRSECMNLGEPRLSVVIPTHNRAALLDQSLASVARQTISPNGYEVVVVDDGSTDDTVDVCRKWSQRMPLTCIGIPSSGIAVAKNVGVFAAAGSILVFFDDDDVADPHLLEEHLKTHERYPLEHMAVLGFTDWSPSLEVSEVMRFVTDVGHYLFSYTHLADGQRLDHTYFWGGRSSCKRSLLLDNGVFRPEFTFGSEDIELGYRLSRTLVEQRRPDYNVLAGEDDGTLAQRLATVGLSVIFNRRAVQQMNRPLTYADFCRRCERQGRSQWQFSRHYTDPQVHRWCQTADALERWEQVRHGLDSDVARVHEIEAMLAAGVSAEARLALLPELYKLYWRTFDAFKTKGIADAIG